jgi:hypothetical protein
MKISVSIEVQGEVGAGVGPGWYNTNLRKRTSDAAMRSYLGPSRT